MTFLLLAGIILPAFEEKPPAASADKPKHVRQLGPALTVDLKKKMVTLDAEVVLREGLLELLICPKHTKEHESILAADVKPRAFQTALLMVGAVPGHPARAEPPSPPTGHKLKVTLEYEENGKTKRVEAQQWIRNIKAAKPLEADFVFAGSRFVKVPGVEKVIWAGDDGDLVCVANFPGSIVDIAIQSSKENAELMFEAWTDRVPAKGTKVRVIFEPIPGGEPAPAAAQAAKS